MNPDDRRTLTIAAILITVLIVAGAIINAVAGT